MIHFLKMIYVVMTLLGYLFTGLAYRVEAQENIQQHMLELTWHKTSSVIFPAIIKSVDRGSRDIIAQRAKEVGNVLQLKAGKEYFPETNLTVITADGILHEFTVNYARQPRTLSMNILANTDTQNLPILFQTAMTESNMEKYSAGIINAGQSRTLRREREFKIGLSLNGIYVKDDVMFYHMTLTNTSNINYDVDFLRFYIRDQQKVKRTASQEVDVKPVYIYGNNGTIRANSSQEIVYALNKFTIPDAKNLVIEMFEQNGGRHLTLSIKNKTIVNALKIP